MKAFALLFLLLALAMPIGLHLKASADQAMVTDIRRESHNAGFGSGYDAADTRTYKISWQRHSQPVIAATTVFFVLSILLLAIDAAARRIANAVEAEDRR